MKSCDTPLSALLIAIVVLGMGMMSLRLPDMPEQTVEKVEVVQIVDDTTSLQNASFYLHSTIAQVLAAAFALLLVVALPNLQSRSQKALDNAKEHERVMKEEIRQKHLKSMNIQFADNRNGAEAIQFLNKFQFWLKFAFLDIIFSLSMLLATPFLEVHIFWIISITNITACAVALFQIYRLINICFSEFRRQFDEIQFKVDRQSAMAQASKV